MGKINLHLGSTVHLSKTFSEADVYRYAGIIGDFNPLNTNEEYCRSTPLKTRTVQSCLVFSLANPLSAMIGDSTGNANLGIGFDNVQFPRPVYFGDTLFGSATVSKIDEEQMRVYADYTMTNQHGEVVMTCVGIIKILDQ